MLLLDQGLPRSTTNCLRVVGLEADHAGDVGLATAPDSAILARARDHAQIVVTLDADFHAQLALSGAAGPSVIRIRIEGLKAQQLADLLVRVLEQCGEDLKTGAMVTVTESSVRIRRLPLIRV
jgi:predicted nuclease of predicted toxin-antitoxin system